VPTVAVHSPNDVAYENPTTSAVLMFQRFNTTANLTINYILGGTAVYGNDYTTNVPLNAGHITLLAGQQNTTVQIQPTMALELI